MTYKVSYSLINFITSKFCRLLFFFGGFFSDFCVVHFIKRVFFKFQPIDSKRDEFRKFLERSGLIDLVSKCFIKLYEETDKPENPIDYFRENIGDAMKEKMTIKLLQAELEEVKRENEELKKKLKKPDENESINKSTDSDMVVEEDVVILEEKIIENTPEKIEVKETEKVEEEVKPEVEVIPVEDDKEKEKEKVEEKKEPLEVVADIVVKTDEVEEVKTEEPKVEVVEETESSKVATTNTVAPNTESDPKPEEVTKESS